MVQINGIRGRGVAAGFNSPYVIPRASNMAIDRNNRAVERFQVEIMPVIHYRGFATMKMRMRLIKLLQTIMNLKRQTCDLLCDDHHGPGERGKKASVYVSCLHLKLSLLDPHVRESFHFYQTKLFDIYY